MNLAATSPKQMRALSAEIAEDRAKLDEFLSSLKLHLENFPLDNGAFRDELLVLGANLSKSGVLRQVGVRQLADVLSEIRPEIVEAFVEAIDAQIANAINARLYVAMRDQASLPVAKDMIAGTSRQNAKIERARQVVGGAHYRPLHDRVVVRRVESEAKTKGGIIIPDTAKEKPQEGEIVAVGTGARDESGNIVALDVKAGDRVLFGKWSGTEVKIDGEDLLIMKEADIMGIIG